MKSLDTSFSGKLCSSMLTISGEYLPKRVPPRFVPPPRDEKLWQNIAAIKLHEERRERLAHAHRANRLRRGNCHTRSGTARPLNAGTANTGPSATTGPSVSRVPFPGARPFGNASTPTSGGLFTSDGPSGRPSSSENISVPGIGDQDHANTDTSEKTSDPRVEVLPNQTEFSHLCWICRRPFQISSGIKDNWKCFHQPPSIGKDGDLLPAQLCESGHNPSIHVCCWEVAQIVFDDSILSVSHRSKMFEHLKFLSPFAEPTPFDVETNSIDLELFTDSNSMSVMSEDGCRQLRLEAELSKVSQLLDQNQAILTIDELRKVDPCLAQWMMMANSYSLSMNKSLNVRLSSERVVKNLRESDASRFPKAYNFRVTWHNVQEAVRAMESLPDPEMIPLDRQLKGVGKYVKYRVPVDKCGRLSFFFLPCNKSRMYRLVGLACDGKTIGCCPIGFPHVRLINLNVQTLRGLRFAQTRCGQITAFKVKDDKGWSHTWHGEPQHACDEVGLHWTQPKQDLVVHFDVSIFLKRSFGFVLTISAGPKRNQRVHYIFLV